jgi:UDP-N-acetylmuramyl tripeptide synthase
LLLVKNPVAFIQVLENFLSHLKKSPILIVINDHFADGRDVSWLWDVPLETLAANCPLVYTAGTRGIDMALRLHYAGISAQIMDSLDEAINQLVGNILEGEHGFILSTYTAMLEVRKLLGKRVTLEEAW